MTVDQVVRREPHRRDDSSPTGGTLRHDHVQFRLKSVVLEMASIDRLVPLVCVFFCGPLDRARSARATVIRRLYKASPR